MQTRFVHGMSIRLISKHTLSGMSNDCTSRGQAVSNEWSATEKASLRSEKRPHFSISIKFSLVSVAIRSLSAQSTSVDCLSASTSASASASRTTVYSERDRGKQREKREAGFSNLNHSFPQIMILSDCLLFLSFLFYLLSLYSSSRLHR